WLAPSSPTRITVRPGRGLPAATSASTSALVLSSSWRAIALPSMMSAILLVLRVVLVDPLGRGGQRAERVEVQAHAAVLFLVELLVERIDQLVRAGAADQVGQRDAVLLHHAGRSADAAALGEPEQALDAGRAGDAETDRNVDAAAAHFTDPLDDRVVVEGELRDHQRGDPARAQGGDLLFHPHPKLFLGDVGVAFRMAADTGDRDAMLFEKTGLDDLQRVLEGTFRLRRVAGDHEHALHAGFAGDAGEIIVEHVLRAETASGQVYDRLEAELTDELGGIDPLLHLFAGKERHGDLRTGADQRRGLAQTVELFRRHFQRVAIDHVAARLFPIGVNGGVGHRNLLLSFALRP